MEWYVIFTYMVRCTIVLDVGLGQYKIGSKCISLELWGYNEPIDEKTLYLYSRRKLLSLGHFTVTFRMERP